MRVLRGVAATIVIALLFWWGGRAIAPRILPLVSRIRTLGPLAPAMFIALYVVGVVALIPASWFTLASGAVFGAVAGTIYSLVGATIGSTAALLLGRHVARTLVERHLATRPRFVAIDRAVSSQGLRIVLLLRLSPVTPFNFLNYALAMTTISAADFTMASIGMIPATILYAYAGKVAGEALAIAGKTQIPHGTSYYTLLIAGLLATTAAATAVTRAARRALRNVDPSEMSV